MQDWNYLKTNDFEVTIELSCDKLVDESTLSQYWNENKHALLSFIGQVHYLRNSKSILNNYDYN